MNNFDIAEAIREVNQSGIRVWLIKMLSRAFEEARKGKLKTYDEHAFEANWIYNLATLRDAILEERYEPGPSKAFVVFEPMVREIFAARFRDRVVHHFLFMMQAEWWDKRFISNSFACRKGKGTHYGIRRTQAMMQAAIDEAKEEAAAAGRPKSDWKTKEFCPKIIKMDISGYFMSLPRDLVYKRIKWGLEKQFNDYMDDPVGFRIYKMCEYLWAQIIFDDPASKALKRGRMENWNPDILPPRKSLFCQKPGIGLVIGNLTSQLCSNVYLDQLDRFVRFDLGYKRYGRYVDDFYLIVRADEYRKAKEDILKIEKFLKDNLQLTLHPKKRYCQEVQKGMEFIGARIYPYCKYPSDRLQGKFRVSTRKMAAGYGKMDSLISYLGLMSQLDADRFVEKIFDELGWRYCGPIWGAAGEKAQRRDKVTTGQTT